MTRVEVESRMVRRPILEWRLRPRDQEVDARLASDLNVSHLMAILLANRGFTTSEAARTYIQPRLKDLEEPDALMDMQRGAERLTRAIRSKERVLVYGDYDVDGMVGTVVLVNFLRLAGADVDWYIPDRTKEGYSFNDSAIAGFLAATPRPSVIVTVDHGTSAHEGIARLAQGGVDVIVTDHHEPPETLPPDVCALINPRRPGCPSKFKDLCGAAVAFKLVWATAQKLSNDTKVSQEFRDYLVDATAFVAMATITDVVKLSGDNRVLCYHGLRALPASRTPGVKALLRTSRLDGQSIQAMHVGFRIGPRLNAAGRLGTAEKVVELLTTADPGRASRLADELEQANTRRQEIEKEILLDAERMLKKDPPGACDAICLGSTDWHPGVIGVVCSRLVDRYQLPVILVALNGDKGRGSARAPAGIHLRDLLAQCAEHLVSFGGHAGAAGCTVTESEFPRFQARLRASAQAMIAARPLARTLDIDCELPLGRIRPAFIEELELLAPHGSGNPTPLFCAHDLRIAGNPTSMGVGGVHLSFHATDGEAAYRVVAWNQGPRLPELIGPMVRISLAYRLKFDKYRGPGNIELEAQDFTVRRAP